MTETPREALVPGHTLPISVTMAEATRLSGIGRTGLYALIKRGQIRAKKAGRVTLILVNSLSAHIEGLPDLHQAIDDSPAAGVADEAPAQSRAQSSMSGLRRSRRSVRA